MLIDGDYEPIFANAKAFRGGIEDAHVGLMWNQPVDGIRWQIGVSEHLAWRIGENVDGELEHRLAVHAQERIARHAPVLDPATGTQDRRLRAVGVQSCAKYPRRIPRLEYHRARAVAEQ